MKYKRIQRNDSKAFITIGEYILLTNPEVYAKLIRLSLCIMAVEGFKQAISNFKKLNNEIFENLARIMAERPKPGRGGLLPGESEDALYE